MSLLIDALKKYRHESASTLLQAEGDVIKRVLPGRTKKIVLISLVVVIVVSITSMASFLIFKHLEKKRIEQGMQGKMAELQKIKAKLAEKSGEAAAGSEAPAGGLRAKLEQRMQQKNGEETSAAVASDATTTSATDESAAPATTDTSAAETTPAATSPVAAGGRALRDKLAARKAATDNSQENSSASSDTNASSQTASAEDTTDTTSSQTDTTSDADTTSDTDTTSDADTSSDNTSDSDTSGDSDSSKSGIQKVNIQVVPDQIGANNPTYQKALSFMQMNQYDKALPLLVDNDDLLMKTQGLSALLLARIYLTTGQFALADEVLDHAIMLHVGSDMELLGLRAQALFMQHQYQEAVDLLSTQSPDLTASPGYYSLLADAYMHLEQPDNAASIFQQIVARFPDSPEYWLGLAVAYQKTGDATGAIVAYRRAAQLSQNDPQVTLFINQQLQALQAI